MLMVNDNPTHVFTLKVDNEFGVLTRITALIRRSGWNIKSLSVAETSNTDVSRLTIGLECRHHGFQSVLDKLGRQSCVREITVFSPQTQVARELVLFRVTNTDPAVLDSVAAETGAEVLERPAPDTALYSLCTDPGKFDLLMPFLLKKGLGELARTGTIALSRTDKEDE